MKASVAEPVSSQRTSRPFELRRRNCFLHPCVRETLQRDFRGGESLGHTRRKAHGLNALTHAFTNIYTRAQSTPGAPTEVRRHNASKASSAQATPSQQQANILTEESSYLKFFLPYFLKSMKECARSAAGTPVHQLAKCDSRGGTKCRPPSHGEIQSLFSTDSSTFLRLSDSEYNLEMCCTWCQQPHATNCQRSFPSSED